MHMIFFYYFSILGKTHWTYKEEQSKQYKIKLNCSVLFETKWHALYGDKHWESRIIQKSPVGAGFFFDLIFHKTVIKKWNMQDYIIRLNNLLEDYNKETCPLSFGKFLFAAPFVISVIPLHEHDSIFSEILYA